MLVALTIVNLVLVLGGISLAAYISTKLSEIKTLKGVVETIRELAKKDLDTEQQIVVDMKEVLALMEKETQAYQRLIDVSQEWLDNFEAKAYLPNVQSPEKKKRGRPRKNNTPTDS
jgi:bacterioferritin (cytochrome b1)